MKIQILSRKFIKPSVPTPPHLKNMKISSIDQLAFPIYVSVVFYYPSNSNECRAKNVSRLEKSLADTLTLFYPLAGRYIKEKLIVDCNDQGAEVLEAQVDGQLAQLLHGEPDVELLDHFFPLVTESDVNPLVAIQINVFNCGGIAIGMSISHKIADGFTLMTFVTKWATMSRAAGTNQVCNPSFIAASLFPPRDLSWVKPPFSRKEEPKYVMRRFVFDGSAILTLKAKAKAKVGANDLGFRYEPTRLDVLVALIWKALIGIAQAKHGHFRPSLLTLTMNLRGKMCPPVPENCCGNLSRNYNTGFVADQSKMELHDLVILLGDAKRKAFAECEKAQLGDDGLTMLIDSLQELREQEYKGEVDAHKFTSWCRFPLYEADFGWGKPTWISSGSVPTELVILMDTKSGDGIEAWVSLDEMDMPSFQQDPNILAYIS